MNLSALKRYMQDHLTDGLVLVIGSGLSAELGVATMAELGAHILANPPTVLTPHTSKEWSVICDQLKGGRDLEAALSAIDLSQEIEEHIIATTARLIESQEYPIFRDAIAGHRQLPLSKLLQHLAATSSCVPVVTTNYDRLIELAADLADIGVDSMFCGQVLSRFNPYQSREALGFATHTRKRNDIQRKYRKHIKLFKPHGSVDWYSHDQRAVRSGVPVDLPRLMIAPGKSKFLRGYEQPFDSHRNEANEAVDRAARFLVLGYGFNDHQLETHLRPRIMTGRPCLIMTRHLTSNAAAIVASSASVAALSFGVEMGIEGTLLTQATGQTFHPHVNLWELTTFLNEVLR